MAPAAVEVKRLIEGVHRNAPAAIARAISLVEDGPRRSAARSLLAGLDRQRVARALTLGITGPPGSGKSTLISRLVSSYRSRHKRVGVLAVDPSSPVSGGAILGDRVRMMEHAADAGVVIRSMATRGHSGGLCAACGAAVQILAAAGYNPIMVETVGVGQLEMEVLGLADITVLLTAPGFGDGVQAMKAGLIEVVDILVASKMDSPGAHLVAAEMEALARESHRPFCATSATTGTGIGELVELVESLRKQRTQRATQHAAKKRV